MHCVKTSYKWSWCNYFCYKIDDIFFFGYNREHVDIYILIYVDKRTLSRYGGQKSNQLRHQQPPWQNTYRKEWKNNNNNRDILRLNILQIIVPISSTVDIGYEPRRVNLKVKQVVVVSPIIIQILLKSKNKDWLFRKLNNKLKWSDDMSTCGLLFQWNDTIQSF